MLIALYNRQRDISAVDAVRQKLDARGIDSVVIVDSLPEQHFDFLFSIGGDGTLLSTVHLIGNRGIPVVGINFGHLGFLTTAGCDDLDLLIDGIVQGSFCIEQRTLLSVAVDGICDYALNEAVLHRQLNEPLMRASLYVGDEFVSSYLADGIIVATPTGSTAYSLSCGGPILTPDCGCFVVTPIAAHTLALRPIIVPDNAIMRLDIDNQRGSVTLGLDSRSITLHSGSKVTLQRAPFTISLVRMQGHGFFSAIRSKLAWGM